MRQRGIANGVIEPCRFIRQDVTPGAAGRFLQCEEDDRPYGVSTQAPSKAAGESFWYYPVSARCQLEIGAGGCEPGDRLKPDENGCGISTVTDADQYGAIAEAVLASGDYGPVLVKPGEVSLPVPSSIPPLLWLDVDNSLLDDDIFCVQ